MALQSSVIYLYCLLLIPNNTYANSNGYDSSDAYDDDPEEAEEDPDDEYDSTDLASLSDSALLSLSFRMSIKLPLLTRRPEGGACCLCGDDGSGGSLLLEGMLGLPVFSVLGEREFWRRDMGRCGRAVLGVGALDEGIPLLNRFSADDDGLRNVAEDDDREM